MDQRDCLLHCPHVYLNMKIKFCKISTKNFKQQEYKPETCVHNRFAVQSFSSIMITSDRKLWVQIHSSVFQQAKVYTDSTIGEKLPSDVTSSRGALECQQTD